MTERACKDDNGSSTLSTTRKKRKVKAPSRAPKLLTSGLLSTQSEPRSKSAKVPQVDSKTLNPVPAETSKSLGKSLDQTKSAQEDVARYLGSDPKPFIDASEVQQCQKIAVVKAYDRLEWHDPAKLAARKNFNLRTKRGITGELWMITD
jgi:hypothetical protein